MISRSFSKKFRSSMIDVFLDIGVSVIIAICLVIRGILWIETHCNLPGVWHTILITVFTAGYRSVRNSGNSVVVRVSEYIDDAIVIDVEIARIALTDNVVQFRSTRYHDNPLVIRGPGAGPDVTAGGVFADLLRLAAYLGAAI